MSLLLTALENPASRRDGSLGVEPRLGTAQLSAHPAAASYDAMGIEPMVRPAGDDAHAPEGAADFWTDEPASRAARKSAPGWGMRHHGGRIFVGCALLAAIAYGGRLYVEGGYPGWLDHAPWPWREARVASSNNSAHSDAIHPHELPAPIDPLPAGGASPMLSAENPIAPPRTAPGNSTGAPDVSDSLPRRPVPQTSPPLRANHTSADISETVAAALPDPESRVAQDGDALESIVRSRRPEGDQALHNAWFALAAGKDREALHMYRSVLQTGPARSDAMLGAAAALTHLGLHEQARRHYLRVLEIDPANAAARTNLLALRVRTGENPSEQEILALVDGEPSDFLYALLGHIRAAGNRWIEARVAFEIAYRLQPASAVHAFNLAVTLEHLGLPESALDYYRRAAALGESIVRSEFDRQLLVHRITVLSHASPG